MVYISQADELCLRMNMGNKLGIFTFLMETSKKLNTKVSYDSRRTGNILHTTAYNTRIILEWLSETKRKTFRVRPGFILSKY